MPPASKAVPPIVHWFTFAIALAVLIAIGVWPESTVGPLLDWLMRRDLTFRLALLSLKFFGWYLVAVVIHEAGHVAGALLGGFTFRSVRASLITVNRSGPPSFSSDLNRLATGETKMHPPTASDARWRYAAYAAFAAGGPAANILAGLLVLALTGKAGLFVVITLFLGIVELLPLENRLGVSDGMRLRMLFFQRPRGDRWIAICRLSADSSDGAFPDKLSPQLLATAIAIRDPSRDTVTAHGLACSAAMSRQEYALAGRMLDVCIQYAAHAAPDVREAMVSDAAVLQAGTRANPGLARQWLADLPLKANPWFRLRAEAAILEASGDLVGAWRMLDGFEQKLVGVGGEQPLLPLVRKWKVGLQNLMPIETPPGKS